MGFYGERDCVHNERYFVTRDILTELGYQKCEQYHEAEWHT